jgi:hypothetical protein
LRKMSCLMNGRSNTRASTARSQCSSSAMWWRACVHERH